MAATSGALLSDHVNYLIFRYLQECGHEATARSFYQDWYRPSEYKDPEELPFASHVRRAALVSVIQDGIRYDELQGRVAVGAQRRHVWSQLSSRLPFSQSKTSLPNGVDAQGSKRKSISTTSPHFDDAHPPLPKRQRTALDDSTRINGHRDAMDIVDQSPSAAVDDEEDGEATSPALASEPEMPVIRYDSVATQTDVLAQKKPPRPGLKARSLRFAVDKPASKLFHAAWNPSKNLKHRRTLLAAGEGLCRLYKMPEQLSDEVTAIPSIDEPSIAEDSMITAIAWHPSGRLVTCAVDSMPLQGGPGRRPTKRTLIDIGPDVGGTISHPDDSSLLQPPGIVLAIEYSPCGEHLLVASTNTKRSLVQVWATPKNGDHTLPRADPIAWCYFERELTDVAWCEDLQIRACTASNQASILMLPEQLEATKEFTPETIRRHNFIEEVLTLPFTPADTSIIYKYDNSHWIDLFFVQHANDRASSEMIVLDLKHHDASNNDEKPLTFTLQQDFTVAALQPEPRNDDTNGEVKSLRNSTRLLAVTFESGDCQIYELGRSNDKMTCKPLYAAATNRSLAMSQGPILAAAWSPAGTYLALAGDDQVQVWNAERTESDLLDDRPLLVWHTESHKTDDPVGANGLNHIEPRHVSLSWDAMGEKLCFVVDEKVSIIELESPSHPHPPPPPPPPTPPHALSSTNDSEVVMNGV